MWSVATPALLRGSRREVAEIPECGELGRVVLPVPHSGEPAAKLSGPDEKPELVRGDEEEAEDEDDEDDDEEEDDEEEEELGCFWCF